MTDAEVMPSLWDAFFDDRSLPDSTVVKLEGHSDLGELRDQLRSVTVAGFAEGVRESLGQSVKALLALPLSQVLGGAWSTYRKLLEYCDREKHPPEERATVTLLSHTIESTHKPYVDVLINGMPKGKVDFEVRLALHIESAAVLVRDARIWEVRPGACRAEGSVKCGQIVLAEKKLQPMKIPGVIRFPEGIPIKPALLT